MGRCSTVVGPAANRLQDIVIMVTLTILSSSFHMLSQAKLSKSEYLISNKMNGAFSLNGKCQRPLAAQPCNIINLHRTNIFLFSFLLFHFSDKQQNLFKDQKKRHNT